MTNKFKLKKLSSNTKKAILLSCMVALLVVTGVLNFVFNDKIKNPGGGGNTTVIGKPDETKQTFFSDFRSTRETTRASEMMVLDTILASIDSTAETKATATAKKMQILGYMETELVLENLIKAKGLNDVVVTLSEKNVNIIVASLKEGMDHKREILSVVEKGTSYKVSEIFIIPLEV